MCPNRVPVAEAVLLLLLKRPLSLLDSVPMPESREGLKFERATLFPGCLGRYLFKDKIPKLIKAFQGVGLFLETEDFPCCGMPLLRLSPKAFLRQAERCARRISHHEILVTMCSSCFWIVSRVLPLLFPSLKGTKVFDLSMWLGSLKTSTDEFFLHVPCHLRGLLKPFCFDAIEECCGTPSLRDLFWDQKLSRRFIEKVYFLNKKVLVTACSGCYFKLKRAVKSPPEVKHWVEIVGV